MKVLISVRIKVKFGLSFKYVKSVLVLFRIDVCEGSRVKLLTTVNVNTLVILLESHLRRISEKEVTLSLNFVGDVVSPVSDSFSDFLL